MSNIEGQQPTTPTPNLDIIRQVNPYGQEYWSARDLMPLLGYQSWREFNGVINRAIMAAQNNGQNATDHFVSGYKMITAGKGASRRVSEYNLSRLACYLIAENGNPRIVEVAAAQVYFAVAARTHELREFASKQNSRVELRERVAEGNKSLTEAAANIGVRSQNFGTFHDAVRWWARRKQLKRIMPLARKYVVRSDG